MPAAPGPDRPAVARALREIAQRLSLSPGDQRFRARAYEHAARTLERSEQDLGRLVAEKRLTELPGIGPALAAVITEVYETGRSARLERLRDETPAGVLALAPVVGLTTARALHDGLGISSVAALREACEQGRVREVRGFGPKREAALLERLRRYETQPKTLRLVEALAEGARVVAALNAVPRTEAEIVGAVRRGAETVADIEVLATTEDPDAVRAALIDGSPVRVTVSPVDARPVDLLRRTGSEAHVRRLEQRAKSRGLRLQADGLGDRRIRSERDVYAALDLPFIPAELREDDGEIEAAEEGRLPELVRVEEVIGAVHCHTVASDGRHTLLQMAQAAEARGFRYLTVTDHSPSAHYARGLTRDRLEAQWEEIARVQEQVQIRLLRGTECDITRDGALDWPDAVIEQLDVVVASIHERFRMDATAMTRRIVSALRHPAFKIWGHPLGRLIGRRPPFECDFEAILDALTESRAAIEINGDPYRLDLEPRLVREARRRGLKFVISTDAHAMHELGNVRYGTLMARRGWLTGEDVLNTRDADTFAQLVRPLENAVAPQSPKVRS
jgi:DNA polymerase (family 10)